MTHSLPRPLPVDVPPADTLPADVLRADVLRADVLRADVLQSGVLRTDTPPPESPWAERTRELAVTLTGWPSVTGSPGETQFAPLLQALLRRWPTLRQEDVWLSPARHGHPAWNLYALAVNV